MCDYSHRIPDNEETDWSYEHMLTYMTSKDVMRYERKLGRELTQQEKFHVRVCIDRDLNVRHSMDKQPNQNIEMAEALKAWGVRYSEIPF